MRPPAVRSFRRRRLRGQSFLKSAVVFRGLLAVSGFFFVGKAIVKVGRQQSLPVLFSCSDTTKILFVLAARCCPRLGHTAGTPGVHRSSSWLEPWVGFHLLAQCLGQSCRACSDAAACCRKGLRDSAVATLCSFPTQSPKLTARQTPKALNPVPIVLKPDMVTSPDSLRRTWKGTVLRNSWRWTAVGS